MTVSVRKRFLHDAEQRRLDAYSQAARDSQEVLSDARIPLRLANPSTYQLAAEANPAKSRDGGCSKCDTSPRLCDCAVQQLLDFVEIGRLIAVVKSKQAEIDLDRSQVLSEAIVQFARGAVASCTPQCEMPAHAERRASHRNKLFPRLRGRVIYGHRCTELRKVL